MRVADGLIRPAMVTVISLPVAILVTVAMEPMLRLGWRMVKPSSVFSCVAGPRWVNGVLCAMQKPVVNNNPSIANIARLIFCLLPLPPAYPRCKLYPIFNYYAYKKKFKIIWGVY
jgi:hypothetical protein